MARSKWSGLSVRMERTTLEALDQRAGALGKTRTQIVYEMVEALIEGRLRIQKTKAAKEAGDIYVD